MTFESLNALVLPESLGLKRTAVIPEGFRNPGFDENYDFRTLFYDAIYVPGKQSICMICPKLLNFESVVKGAVFTVDGNRLTPQVRRRNPRNDDIWLPCSDRPKVLRVSFGTMECEVAVRMQDRETFRGLRCAVLKSRNNDLVWIRDWAEYHVKIHGLQAVLLFDNASDHYTLQDIHGVLGNVVGMEKVRIISVPYSYGVIGKRPYRHLAKFLQGGIINIARLRYLQEAASVLLIDIDELIPPVPDGGIFALTEQSMFGFVSMRGQWRYPVATTNGSARHVEHVYGSPGDDPCPQKYCICPQGPFGNFQWDTHGLSDGFLRNTVKRVLRTSRIKFWHCRKISTHWKNRRELPPPDQLVLDIELKQVLERVFGEPGAV